MLPVATEKHHLEESYLQKLATELTSYGLSTSQARLYLFLLGESPLPGGQISKELGMHRVEVYRQLRRMGDAGVVEVFLDSPRRFAAVEPKSALISLMSKMDSKLSALRESSFGLEERLRIYRSSQRMSISAEMKSPIDSYYKFATGRESYFKEVKRLVDNAKTEVLIITSGNGIIRAYLNGFHDNYGKASRRGVSVKMIADINKNNLKFARRFSQITELRHVDDVHFRFIVADKSLAILSARFDDTNVTSKSDIDNYFIFNDPAVGAATTFLFFHLWRDAIDFTNRLDFMTRNSN